jgi:hypothetical protein
MIAARASLGACSEGIEPWRIGRRRSVRNVSGGRRAARIASRAAARAERCHTKVSLPEVRTRGQMAVLSGPRGDRAARCPRATLGVGVSPEVEPLMKQAHRLRRHAVVRGRPTGCQRKLRPLRGDIGLPLPACRCERHRGAQARAVRPEMPVAPRVRRNAFNRSGRTVPCDVRAATSGLAVNIPIQMSAPSPAHPARRRRDARKTLLPRATTVPPRSRERLPLVVRVRGGAFLDAGSAREATDCSARWRNNLG